MYLGIDASTGKTGKKGTAACLIDESAQILRLATFRPPLELDRIQSLVWTRNQLQALFNLASVAAIEHYAFARVNQAHYLGELGGLLRVSMYGFLPFYEITPATMKKYVTGSGNSAKEIVMEKCFRKFKVGSDVLKDNNQVDAYCLAMLLRHYLAFKFDGKVKCADYEKAAFKKISEPMGRLPIRLAVGKA